MDRRLNSSLTCKFRIPFFLFFMCDKKGEERLCRKAVIPYRLVSSVVIKRVKAVELLTK